MTDPKGKMLIIGGAEDLAGQDAPDMETKNIMFKRYEILKVLLSASKKSIAVITSASGDQSEMRRTYSYAFEELGYTEPDFIQVGENDEANDPKVLSIIKETGAVFFTGGDQSRLTSLLKGTELVRIIKERYLTEEDFLIAGTSAGAMALSNIMITEGGPDEALLASKENISEGLGIVKDAIIDTHFIKRGRIGRLTHAALLHPHHIGIGLGEDTALIIKDNIAECRGSGMVVIVDTQSVSETNIEIAKEGEPIYAGDIKIHLLVKGARFSFKENKIIKS